MATLLAYDFEVGVWLLPRLGAHVFQCQHLLFLLRPTQQCRHMLACRPTQVRHAHSLGGELTVDSSMVHDRRWWAGQGSGAIAKLGDGKVLGSGRRIWLEEEGRLDFGGWLEAWCGCRAVGCGELTQTAIDQFRRRQGRLETMMKKVPLYYQAAALFVEVFRHEHVDAADCNYNIADLFEKQGKRDEARKETLNADRRAGALG